MKIIKYKYIILSFIIPIFFFIGAIILGECYPFGENSLCPYDSLHQYIPFLSEYKYKLLHGESLFFSLRAASEDFYILWLYYLTSPLNIFILFFKDIIIGFDFLIILKVSLIGLSMALYLRRTYKKCDISITVFSTAYSLSSYVIAYYYSIMWLDILIIFPFLITSFKKLMANKKNIYPLLLAFVIYSNFYMSIQVCIFLCLFFLMQEFDDLKDFIKKGLRFTLLSIIGGGMAAVFYIPFFSVINNKLDNFPCTYFLTDFSSLFMSLCTMCSKNVAMSYKSNANIYCGVVCLFFFFIYIFNKRISIENRIKNIFLICLLFLSMNISSLDFMMHGFDKPTGYMARYSYIFIFLIITCAFEAFSYRISSKNYVLAFISSVSLMLINMIYLFIKKEDFIPIVCSLLVIALCFLFRKRKNIILALLIIELVITGANDFKVAGVDLVQTRSNAYENLKVDDDFHRSDIDIRSISNESIYNNMNGMSLFSSTLVKPFTSFTFKLGLRGGTNYITTFGHSSVIDILYNLKYIYNQAGEQYFDYNEVETNLGFSRYENVYDTSYGYLVPKSILKWDWDNDNPFSNINNFVGYYFDRHDSNTYVYDLISYEDIIIEDDFYTLVENQENNFSINFEKDDEEDTVSFIYKTEYPTISINIKYGGISSCHISVNDEVVVSDNKINGDIINLYNLNNGDTIKVTINPEKDEESGKIYCNFAHFNEENFKKFADDIISNKVDITSIKDNKVSGTYKYDENKLLLLSFPYKDGWNLKIGDKNIEINKDLCFMISEIDDSGTFEMNYITPLFKESLLISIIFCIIYLIIKIIMNKYQESLIKKKQYVYKGESEIELFNILESFGGVYNKNESIKPPIGEIIVNSNDDNWICQCDYFFGWNIKKI